MPDGVCSAVWRGRLFLFPRAMRKIAMFAWIFDECREGQNPSACIGAVPKNKIMFYAYYLVYPLEIQIWQNFSERLQKVWEMYRHSISDMNEVVLIE